MESRRNFKKENRRINSSSQDTSDEEFIPTEIKEREYSKELKIKLMEYYRARIIFSHKQLKRFLTLDTEKIITDGREKSKKIAFTTSIVFPYIDLEAKAFDARETSRIEALFKISD